MASRLAIGIGLVILGLIGHTPSRAEQPALEDVLVYIKCNASWTATDGRLVKVELEGTGFLVSDQGHVLTARHVVYADSDSRQGVAIDAVTSECEGAIGNANRGRDIAQIKAHSASFDAALLKLPVSRQPYVKFCRLRPSLRMAQIYSTGFPKDTKTGVPSTRVGVLSTIEDDGGLIETDGLLTAGMSGGLTTLARSGAAIAMAIGVETEGGTGLVNFHGVLPLFLLRREFAEIDLEEASEGCLNEPRKSAVLGHDWDVSQGKLNSEVTPAEGICYLVGVTGSYPSDGNKLWIEIDDDTGTYVLRGTPPSSGTYGGLMQCQYY